MPQLFSLVTSALTKVRLAASGLPGAGSAGAPPFDGVAGARSQVGIPDPPPTVGLAVAVSKLGFAGALSKAGFAGQCEVCRQWCEVGALCDDCVARFAAPRPRCGRCGLRLGAAAAVCGDCLGDPPPFLRTACAVDYDFPWDRLIAAFKFRGRVELAATLAMRMAPAVHNAGPPCPELVVPVPLSAARLAERGFNQAWELTRRLAADLQLRADANLLQRPVDTAHQAELGRSERRHNLRTAFMVDPRRRDAVAGRRVALVDDVMTTGATVREAAAVLLRAGAAAVDVWVLARTPATTDTPS